MSQRARIVLMVLLVVAAGVRLRYFSGIQVGDDIVYSTIAAQRVQGDFRVSNVHEARLGFLLPLTLSYLVFGVGEFPLLLYNLLCSIGLVAAVFFLARKFWGDGAGAVAGALAAIHPNLVFFASECHTDTPVALWQALCVLSLLSADSGRSRALRVLAGLLLGWAWLHKEHAIFLVPFIAGYAIATRRPWTWLLPVALPAAAVFAAETALNAVLTGNAFQRFAMVRALHVGHYMTAEYATTGALLRRMFLELPLLLFTPRSDHHWEGTLNLACAASGIFLLVRRAAGARILAGWFTAIFLAYSFWPSSLSPYLPAFLLFYWTLPPLAGPLVCLAGGAAAGARREFVAAAVLILASISLWSIHRSWEEGLKFAAGPREAHAWLARERPARVVTDDKTIEVLDFLDGHRPARTYVPFQKGSGFVGSVVVVDRFWTEPGRWWSRPVAPELQSPPASWSKVYESDRIVIYRP
jgi:4-amino-4-deoxy-L-arabinose transferase-like glycosyltransferase